MLRFVAYLLALTFTFPANAEPCEPNQIGKLVDFYVDGVWLRGEPIVVNNQKLAEHSEIRISFANGDYVLSVESMRQHVSGDTQEIIDHVKRNLASWISPVEAAMYRYGTKPIVGMNADESIWFGTSTPEGCIGTYIPAIPVEWLQRSPVLK